MLFCSPFRGMPWNSSRIRFLSFRTPTTVSQTWLILTCRPRGVAGKQHLGDARADHAHLGVDQIVERAGGTGPLLMLRLAISRWVGVTPQTSASLSPAR